MTVCTKQVPNSECICGPRLSASAIARRPGPEMGALTALTDDTIRAGKVALIANSDSPNLDDGRGVPLAGSDVGREIRAAVCPQE